jgi:hypothetical protein
VHVAVLRVRKEVFCRGLGLPETSLHQQTTVSKKGNQKLRCKYSGPFEILEKIGNVTYQAVEEIVLQFWGCIKQECDPILEADVWCMWPMMGPHSRGRCRCT